MTVPVPEGTHTVDVRLDAFSTPARTAGAVIALVSVTVLPLACLWGQRQRIFENARSQRACAGGTVSLRSAEEERSTWRLDRRASLAATGVVVAFVVIKVGFIDWRHNWFRYTSPSGEALAAQYSLADQPISFGEHIKLLGYDLPRTEVGSGGMLPVTLYWQATSSVPENYQVFAHLTRPTTHLWGQSDALNPGDLPTRRWPLDKYVRDEHELRILEATPPGDYQLTVGLYTLADNVRLPVFDAVGNPMGDTFSLPTSVRVSARRLAPDDDALGMTDVIGVDFADEITLLGAVLPDRRIELPGFVHLALLWRAHRDAPDDITVRLQLVDAEGKVVQEIVTAPVDGLYPSSVWSEGEVVRDQYSLWLDHDFLPGDYDLRVATTELPEPISLGKIIVLAP